MFRLLPLFMLPLLMLPTEGHAQFGFGMGSICASAPGSRPVAAGGGMMCQCPDGSFASMGVPCRSAAPPRSKSTQQTKRVEQTYCGTVENQWSYFCPSGTKCTPDNIKTCTAADGKIRDATGRKLTENQRKAAEASKNAAQQAADKINAARSMSIGDNDQVAKLSAAAGLVSSASQFTQLGLKAQAAIPAKTSSAGLKGWTRGAEAKGERPEGRGYCTDYVRAIWPKITGKPLPAELGDAGQWYDRAQKAGLRTAPASAISQVPPGSIAVWNDGKFGHVGVVIRNDGSALHISEANWGRVPQAASKFERDNVITSSFNRHEERKLSYAAAATRSKSYKLVGFILPE
jgi:surface antigen